MIFYFCKAIKNVKNAKIRILVFRCHASQSVTVTIDIRLLSVSRVTQCAAAFIVSLVGSMAQPALIRCVIFYV